jgi:hypothetical protein
MMKRCAKALTALAAVLVVFLMMGCPAPLDPDLGELQGGPREKIEDPPELPEDLEVLIYGVQTGAARAEGGLPGTTVADAVAGAIFLGEDAVAEDATDLEFSYSQVEGYSLDLEFGVTAVAGDEPAEWQESSLIAGVFPSGSYLVIKATNTELDDTDPGYVTYYKYLIAWGQNGAGIESITIGGRTFPITGIPYVGDDPAGAEGISNTTVYLTAAQIAANRAISVTLRADSKKAFVTWGPSWPTNNTMPTAEFVEDPINTALANSSRIFVRVKSMNGDLWANYIVQVSYANNAVLGTFTAARANAVAPLGTPQGSWNAEGLVNGTPIEIKSPRLAAAVAAHTGGTNAGTVSWAFVPDLETEPVFVALTELQDLAFGGYIYVRTQYNNNFINIYRFPVAEKPLSDDAELTGISLGDTDMNLGTPAGTLDAAVAGEAIPVFIYQVAQATASWADADADTLIAYGLIKGGTPPASYSPAAPTDAADGNTLVIRSTAESGSVILFYKVAISRKISDDATLSSVTIAEIPATMAAPGATVEAAGEGFAKIFSGGGGAAAPAISVVKFPSATVEYAKTSSSGASPASFSSTRPTNIALNECIWLKVTAEDQSAIRYYKFTVNTINTTKVYGRGVPDPAWAAAHPDQVWPNLAANELLTFEKLPDPSYWNAKGHMHAFQDLFHFANGNAVEDLDDWMSRRQELQLIIGYYVRGYVPPIDADTIDISFNPAILTGSSPILVTHKASGRPVTVNISINTSSLTGDVTKWGKLTAGPFSSGTDFHCGSLTLTDITRANLATLYGIPTSANHAPSRDSAGGWTTAIALTAIEGIDLNGDGVIDRETESLYGGWMDPKKALGFTGGSTGGKQAAGRGILGISRQGTTAGVTNPSSSGCFGYTLERFFTTTGYRVDAPQNGLTNPNAKIDTQSGANYGWPADPLPLGSAGVGASWGDLVGTPWYLKAIAVGDPIRGDAATSGYTLPEYGTNSASGRRARAVRGWSPYFEDFSNVPQNNANFGGKATNIAQPYIAWKTPGYSDAYSGIQGWGEGRSEDRASRQWSSNALDLFTDLHYGLRVDTVVNDPHTSEGRLAGVLCTVPADLHFEIALAAPNIVVADDGFITPRCHIQSQWAMWLMIDEVYKFYGEQEGNGQLDTRYPNSGLYNGWDKYIWRNAIWMNWAIHLASTGEKTAGVPYIYNAVVHGNDTTDAAMAEWNIAKFRDSPWSVDDPASRFDFYRMDWGRPRPGGKLANTTDAPTIAERVRRRVDPILADYYKGEMYHVKPAINDPAVDASTYHDAAKAAIASGALVLTGPKFKEIDWRGLIDSPENQP